MVAVIPVVYLATAVLTLVNGQPRQNITQCPDMVPPVACAKEPCAGTKCPRYPEAICVNDYCGECLARFYFDSREVTQCCRTRKPEMACIVKPCDRTMCPRYPLAVCVNDFCRGCYPRYYVGGDEVTHFCPTYPSKCPDGSPPVQCFDQPCRLQKCNKYPQASCVDDYCGGCNARFFFNNREVTQDCCQAPPIQQCPVMESECVVDPCDPQIASCHNYPTATCKADNCRSCKARWFLPDCSQVTDNCQTKVAEKP